MNFRSSFSNPISFPLNRDATNGPIFAPGDSGFTLNHLNQGPGQVGGSGASVMTSKETLLPPNPFSITGLGLHSNSHNLMASQVAHSNTGLGQLGLSHRMTEVKKTIVTAHGVRLHAVLDFDFIPRQQYPVSLSEVTTNSTPRSELLGALSTRDRILLQNNNASLQHEPPIVNSWVKNTGNLINNQPALQIPDIRKSSHYNVQTPSFHHLLNMNDTSNLINNQPVLQIPDIPKSSHYNAQPPSLHPLLNMNDTVNLTNNQPLIQIPNIPKSSHYYAQPPPLHPLLNMNDVVGSYNKVLPNRAEAKTNRDLQSIVGEQSEAAIKSNNPSFTKQRTEIWSQLQPTLDYLQRHVIGQMSTSRRRSEPSNPAATIGDSSQERVAGLMIGSSSHQWQQHLKEQVQSLPLTSTLAEEMTNSKETENDEDYDGQTHSLNRRKYGPYTCPKCRMVFRLSQRFASHIAAHYRHETRAERMKRLTAKFKKRSLGLVQSHYGLTVMPLSSLKTKSSPIEAAGGKRNVGLGMGITIKEEKRGFQKNPMYTPPPPGMPISHPQGMPIPPPPGISHPYEKASLPKVKSEIKNW